MLKYPRPGNRPLLGHVPDEEDWDSDLLGQAHQPRRRFRHLGDAAGAALEARVDNRLDRVDDRQLRGRHPDRLAYRVQVVLGKQKDSRIHRVEPVGPHADLLWGFLARRIKDLAAARGHLLSRMHEQSRLADSGLSPDKHEAAGNYSAPKYAVELTPGEGQTRGGFRHQLGYGDGPDGGRRQGRPCAVARSLADLE